MNNLELRQYFSSIFNLNDEIFSANTTLESDQRVEILLREKVAHNINEEYLALISKSHSIEVMDHEINLFLGKLPMNACVLDVGGCWGWHWRNLKEIRPDITVVILDFVRANLAHAKTLLGGLNLQNIILVHGDICSFLPLHKDSIPLFDAVWSVQTLQHIPSYELAIRNIYSLLKKGGSLNTYSLNIQPPIKFVYDLMGKNYHIKGNVDGMYYLERASKTQLEIIEKVFRSPVITRWTEIIFSPEIFFSRPGRKGSILGKLDARLTGYGNMLAWLARQKSYHCTKI